MTKDEFAALLAEIGGGVEIGIAARRERAAAEQDTLARHDEELWALLCLGDALHRFYRDTLGLVGTAISTITVSPTQSAMANWHLVSFNRFAAAFHLMANGYYFDAMMLARDLWEVALSLAGLRKDIVTLEQLLSLDAGSIAEAEAKSWAIDRTIRKQLIQQNANLSDAAREAIDTFKRLANLATHKSKAHLARNLGRILKKQDILLYPHFDPQSAGVAHNVVSMAAWSLISTLPYLDFALPATEIGWHATYDKVQLAFREGVAPGNVTIQAWPEVIERVFGLQLPGKGQ